MKKSALTLSVLLVLSYPAVCQPKEVLVAFGSSLPPWVLEDGSGGILVDMLKACLKPSGYELKPQLLPYARRIFAYEADQVDIVTDVNENLINERGLKGFYSGDLYSYENFLISLSARGFHITKVEDISPYSLLSWQGAIEKIGGAYAEMALKNKQYRETHNQKTQLRMLFRDRVDFIQLDGNIFEYYRQEMIADGEISKDIRVDRFPLFGKNTNGFLFRSKSIRDACVANLAATTSGSEQP
ncbi:hypothetical protein QWY82_19355 [Simiduia curdlanivorans]|uniref:Solute-binding protein family 3/N-terminal domain-containing protein n=1 Tax=Simiduia curdlanivorans TaxID=1492769 RepID=A0ABV8V2W4_9GAMM|nr:hypothetical protein [Simiduia curdlanivorans]MDN3640965.1 hypothetical protein [Simiduia curdlanivorans]